MYWVLKTILLYLMFSLKIHSYFIDLLSLRTPTHFSKHSSTINSHELRFTVDFLKPKPGSFKS